MYLGVAEVVRGCSRDWKEGIRQAAGECTRTTSMAYNRRDLEEREEGGGERVYRRFGGIQLTVIRIQMRERSLRLDWR